LLRVVRKWRGAQLPVHVPHQLPIVLIGFYVVRWPVPAVLKFTVISRGSPAATLLPYDLVVRRTGVTRSLFGVNFRRMAERNQQPLRIDLFRGR
jgi:hypothetical protein